MSTMAERRALLPSLIAEAGIAGRLRLGTNWQFHGRPGSSGFRCIQVHWTATASASIRNTMPTAGVVRNGHGNLPGPLYNVLVGQNGDVLIVSIGRCNHSGRGNSAALNAAATNNRRLPWGHRPGGDNLTINPHAWAVSADHSGSGPMPAPQLQSMIAVCVAICRLESWSANRIYHHASSTRRKVDVRGWPDFVPLVSDKLRGSSTRSWFDMATEADLRKVVREELSKLKLPRPVPTQVIVTEDRSASDEGNRRVLIDYATRTAHHLPPDEAEYWTNLGKSSSNPEVISGGTWTTDRLQKHCRHFRIEF